MRQERILVVDDEKLIRWSLRESLSAAGFDVSEAGTGEQATRLLLENDYDLMLLDYRLPDTDGLELLEQAQGAQPEMSVVMMTAYGTVESAVQAMKLGAFDFLTKPVNLDALVLVVQKALEGSRLRREVRRLRKEHREAHGGVQIIGRSPAMRDLLSMIRKVCASEAATVLIQGESGTGKDLVAKAIHYGSQRADRPFVNITCSALTETLLESELFGHERGAFTDAKLQKKGLLEVADGGTAFLDEIGEMGLAMQAKMLRFLEEKTFKRVGGTKDIHVDVRIVAATNTRLEDAVREGRFRADLYYRLCVIPMQLPPLRARREDIPLLAQHFLEHYNREFRKSTNEIDEAALERLIEHDWPGNIRELRNVIERVLILENKPRIEVADLPREMAKPRDAGHGADPPGDRLELPLDSMSLVQLEKTAIRQALERCGDNQVKAARLLGVSRDTLRYRMKKFGFLEHPLDGA